MSEAIAVILCPWGNTQEEETNSKDGVIEI